jgi:hypothetical protein
MLNTEYKESKSYTGQAMCMHLYSYYLFKPYFTHVVLGKLFYMWWFPNHTGFPFDFLHKYGNLTKLKLSFKWVNVMLPYTEGEGCL